MALSPPLPGGPASQASVPLNCITSFYPMTTRPDTALQSPLPGPLITDDKHTLLTDGAIVTNVKPQTQTHSHDVSVFPESWNQAPLAPGPGQQLPHLAVIKDAERPGLRDEECECDH